MAYFGLGSGGNQQKRASGSRTLMIEPTIGDRGASRRVGNGATRRKKGSVSEEAG